MIKHASALNIDKDRITMVGESAGACILLGVAQECIKRGEENLVKLLIPLFPMVGDMYVNKEVDPKHMT